MSVLELRHVSRTYGQGAAEVHALADVDLAVEAGEMVAVMGPSGSGKSTLLTIAGSLEEPTSGEVLIGGAPLTKMSSNAKARLRRRSIGYVFQDFNLLPGLTAAENVALPLELDGTSARKAHLVGLKTLDDLGLGAKAGSFPDQLSGGERQRVAIARAVVGDRRLLLADEPSGALDSVNGEAVMRLIHAACKRGVAAVVVTHDAQLASWADRVVFLRDGRVTDHTAPLPGPESLLSGGAEQMSATATMERSAVAGTPDGGVPARRAVIRWAWRLFRREWRQQLLVLALLMLAVAATIWGAGVATNTPPSSPSAATFGTASALVTLPGNDPRRSEDIAAVTKKYGPADVIENQDISTGLSEAVQLRAQDPPSRYGGPMLSLVSGHHPNGPGQVALTSQVASVFDTGVGGVWHADGQTWHVTGIVQNPSNLLDEFALVAPGQVTAPSQVTILLGPAAVPQDQNQGPGPGPSPTLPDLPKAATISYPTAPSAGIPPATIVLVVLNEAPHPAGRLERGASPWQA